MNGKAHSCADGPNLESHSPQHVAEEGIVLGTRPAPLSVHELLV
jgi:hypothetical protein